MNGSLEALIFDRSRPVTNDDAYPRAPYYENPQGGAAWHAVKMARLDRESREESSD